MSYCTHCDVSFPDGWSFCGGCGLRLSPDPAPMVSAPVEALGEVFVPGPPAGSDESNSPASEDVAPSPGDDVAVPPRYCIFLGCDQRGEPTTALRCPSCERSTTDRPPRTESIERDGDPLPTGLSRRAPVAPQSFPAGHLLLIRAYGDRSETGKYPALDAAGRLELEPGEEVAWYGTAHVNCQSFTAGRWSREWGPLPDEFAITLTTSRAVFICEKFTKGGTWVGFGVVGLAVAGTAMAVSAAKARSTRSGRAAVGQVRYDWISVVQGGGNALQMVVAHPVAALSINLTVRASGSPGGADLEQRLRRLVATHRLAAAGLDEDAKALLTETKNHPQRPGSLPGFVAFPQLLTPSEQTSTARSAPTPRPDGSGPVAFSVERASDFPPRDVEHAGWHPDPFKGVRGVRRWWDGDAWTDRTDP